MFGSRTSSSSSNASGSSASGIGDFKPSNNISFGAGLINKPLHLVVLAGLAYVGFRAYRKFKK